MPPCSDLLDAINDRVVREVHDENGRGTFASVRLRAVEDQEPVMLGTEVKMMFEYRQ